MRPDKRTPSQLRPVSFQLNYVKYPEGSVLISTGNTRVLCNVTIEPGVPPWMKNQARPGGWVTAEYAMLPRSTHTRTKRETGSASARSQEIKRLVGRALRASVDLARLGERTLTVDCDVIQADGGTRTASITGGYVALCIALHRLIERGELKRSVFLEPVAAVSVGIMDERPLLDLCYEEDAAAQADSNFVMTRSGGLIEVQATAEHGPFSGASFLSSLKLARKGITELIRAQLHALKREGISIPVQK